MRRTRIALAVAVAGFAIGLATTSGVATVPATSKPLVQIERTHGAEPIQPIETGRGLDPAIVALGERLFHEKRLSRNGTVSCASCHDIAHGGDDGKPVAIGIDGSAGQVNAPTVLNAALNFRQFWDGRAATLEEQAGGPISSELEMAGDWDEILRFLASDPSYRTAFEQAFSDGLQQQNVLRAIADFERTLITPNAPFDRFLRGDDEAISEAAQRGYRLFKDRGCIACHQGQNVGGNLYQKFGIFADYFADRGALQPADLGRFNVTEDERDKHVFKVPSLRNIELTSPYLHDGTASTLHEVVREMGYYQLGRDLPETEIDDLVAFLRSLTGELPE